MGREEEVGTMLLAERQEARLMLEYLKQQAGLFGVADDPACANPLFEKERALATEFRYRTAESLPSEDVLRLAEAYRNISWRPESPLAPIIRDMLVSSAQDARGAVEKMREGACEGNPDKYATAKDEFAEILERDVKRRLEKFLDDMADAAGENKVAGDIVLNNTLAKDLTRTEQIIMEGLKMTGVPEKVKQAFIDQAASSILEFRKENLQAFYNSFEDGIMAGPKDMPQANELLRDFSLEVAGSKPLFREEKAACVETPAQAQGMRDA